MEEQVLTLSDNDPKVIDARKAEKNLFDFYGLQPKEHYIFLPNQGIKVRILEFGSGKPVVIVPGNTGDVFPLASLLVQMKGRRIIAINRPGGGLSEGMDHTKVNIRQFAVSTLDTILEAFTLENVDVVAHSMGAHWSLWLAMDRPKRVAKLVLLGNPGNVMQGRPPFLMRLISKPPFNKFLLGLLTPTNKEKALNPLKSMGHNKQTLAGLPKELSYCYYYFRFLPHYNISFISLMENAAPTIDENHLKQVSQPAMLLLGTRDTFASIKTGKNIVAALPQGTFHAIQEAGHLPWLESPEECGNLIREFFKQS